METIDRTISFIIKIRKVDSQREIQKCTSTLVTISHMCALMISTQYFLHKTQYKSNPHRLIQLS